MSCYHNPDLPDCPCIDAAEDARDNPPSPDDYDRSYYDNAFESAMYPNLWDRR